MRIYSDELERTIRLQRLAREWLRSRLIDDAQHEKIAGSLHVDARRTNRFLRLILFGFALSIIRAAVTLVAVVAGTTDRATLGALSVVAAAVCVALAELLIRRFHAYRFGVEEACVVAGVALVAIAAGIFANSLPGTILVALSAASIAAFAAYRRYGYVYAGLGAMACAAVIPFQLNIPGTAQRLLAAAVLAVCAVAARIKRRPHGDEFPGDDYAAIEASAWLGLYASLNLRLVPWVTPAVATPFYWLTFAIIWLLPAAGLWISLRGRDRLLLDASLVMTLATLLTNKPYLHATAKPWDPIVLGVLLIGTAIAVRRWLAGGHDESRRGFTATRVLRSDQDALAAAAIVSAPFHPATAPSHVEPPAPDPFEGGRSGGGGGGASF